MAAMIYRFESLGNGHYQVRLNGEFVMYTDHKDVEKVDAHLAANGWESREQYFDAMIEENMKLFEK